MSVDIGTRLGSLEITALLGKGGMGEVYRAHDTKLNRDVAIKVLPDVFANDPERVARFHREAQSVAALNHPNIAAIYDLEETHGAKFLVLELVEGETLADLLRRGPLPLDETLNVTHQICEALEAAHEKGVIHRDLKPANVKVTPEGKVKVLDFGLAKALDSTPASSNLHSRPRSASVQRRQEWFWGRRPTCHLSKPEASTRLHAATSFPLGVSCSRCLQDARHSTTIPSPTCWHRF